jgi:hypothetical protein
MLPLSPQDTDVSEDYKTPILGAGIKVVLDGRHLLRNHSCML